MLSKIGKRITIGEAVGFRRPESWEVIPDDRQEKVEILGGVHVIDRGVVAEGEIIQLTTLFLPGQWEIIKSYWLNRSKIAVIDEQGQSYTNRRIKIQKYGYKEHWDVWEVQMEIWAV